LAFGAVVGVVESAMSVEGILFYGVTIPGNDPGWQRLRAKYDDDTGRMLVEHFHPELLEDKQWAKRFRQFAGDYLSALAQKLPPEEVFGGCRLNGYGDLRQGPGRFYVAVCGTEIMGRTEGGRVEPELLESRSRREWDTRLRRFCERLGVGFGEPRWQLAFWWC
jgi:hypothetical protein